jgi:hypothetical protein
MGARLHPALWRAVGDLEGLLGWRMGCGAHTNPPEFPRGRLWAAWIIVGSIAPTLVAFLVVPPIKGAPTLLLWPGFAAGLVINASWGFGTALFLRGAASHRQTEFKLADRY